VVAAATEVGDQMVIPKKKACSKLKRVIFVGLVERPVTGPRTDVQM
jgi:hypothetical protein